MKQGAIAAGHEKTVEAAKIILEDGGNAFDAAIAAVLATFVVEPCMSSIGGGGFMTAVKSSGEAYLLDFFCHTPRQKQETSKLDFYPITINYGTSSEDFHLGKGSMAIPGIIKGLFKAHQLFGTRPMKILAEPAIRFAKEGVALSDFLAYNYKLLDPMLKKASGGDCVYFHSDGTLRKAGDIQKFPALADFLENLLQEGADLFYKGEPAEKIAQACQNGGHILLSDMENYETTVSSPLSYPYKDKYLFTNKPPSTGGSIIAYGLELLAKEKLVDKDSEAFAQQLVEVVLSCQEDRTNGKMKNFVSNLINQFGGSLPDPGSKKWGNTTHLSLMDGEGNAVSITLSNGEGSGFMIPGTDSIMNNMLGEAALLPGGFHSWTPNARLASMMCPSILTDKDRRPELVLGTGGASRIPWMILQILHYCIDYNMSIAEALKAPRLHLDGKELNTELGFQMNREMVESLGLSLKVWDKISMFFGGVHTVSLDKDGGPFAIADHRREGSAFTL